MNRLAELFRREASARKLFLGMATVFAVAGAAYWLSQVPFAFVELAAHAVLVFVAALPLLTMRWDIASRILAAIAGIFLTYVGVAGLVVGLWVYLPTALTLYFAALTPSKVRLKVVEVLGPVFLVIVAALATRGLAAVSDSLERLRPPNTSVVHYTGNADVEELSRLALDLPGVRSISLGNHGQPLATIRVHFEDKLSEQQRELLLRRLSEIPNVTRVELCRC